MKTKKKPAIFTVVFEDESIFKGGENYLDTKWLEIPNKKIKRIFYKLPYGDFLCLSGYDTYYHMIEATKDLNGRRRGEVRIEYAYIMGKRKDDIIVYKIDLKNKNSVIINRNKNNEWIKKLNSNGWKRGKL